MLKFLCETSRCGIKTVFFLTFSYLLNLRLVIKLKNPFTITITSNKELKKIVVNSILSLIILFLNIKSCNVFL